MFPHQTVRMSARCGHRRPVCARMQQSFRWQSAAMARWTPFRHCRAPLPSWSAIAAIHLAFILTIAFLISPTAGHSHHHRYHLPSVHHSHAQPRFAQSPGQAVSTVMPSTMLPHSFPSIAYHQMANYSGDIMLGAVFPIHDRDSNYSCGTLQAESLQQMESLVYSLKRINDDPTILPGIKLGVLVIDSCDSPHHALEQTIDFIKSFVARSNRRLLDPEFTCADGIPPLYKYGQFDRVLGLIGGQSSEVSLQLANLLRLFKVPQVSYMSTSPTLSDKRLYEYFFRTVPSDTNQVDAIVEILKRFQWTYVSVVYSDTEYGNNGYDLLAEAAAKNKICISEPQAIDVERFLEEDYQKVIRRLMYKINARVVVVFADRVIARKLMTAAKALLTHINRMDRFVWIASDAWCCRDFVVHDLEEVVEGSISVTPLSYPLAGFNRYFHNLLPKTNEQNPWFDEFWQQHFQCDLAKNDHPQTGRLCNSSLSLDTDKHRQSLSPSLHFVRDAFYSFAMTFNQMHKKLCNSIPGICEQMREQLWEGSNLVNWLRNVTFRDEGGKLFGFLENGDAPPRYRVVNYQRLSNGSYQWKEVGTYMMSMEQYYSSQQSNPTRILKLNQSDMRFKEKLRNFPQSFCSEPCGPGQAKLKLEGDTCCWLCTNCSQYQFLLNENQCVDCPLGKLPDESKTKCVNLPAVHLSTNNWWTICSILFAVMGMIATVSTWLVFWRYAETPIIKAAGRELSHLHLTGIFLSFAMTFVIISQPSALTCSLNRFFLGFCYTVCYSAIVTKTNRIARIFRHRSTQKPRFTSPRSQLVITSLLIAIEVVITLFWIVYDPPKIEFVYPARDKSVLICSGSDRNSYLLGLLYPLILIGFCTVYAFKTRKCPEGFNEARYITFTNYTTCVVWLTFLPMFVLLGTITEVRYLLICSLMSLSGTVQLSCLFVPKMYIALLKPEKNTRETVMCGGHYSRAILYSNSATNSNATINRKTLSSQRLSHQAQPTTISNDISSSSELDTTTTTALHNEACKQLSSKDSQLETTSVGGESIAETATALYMTNQNGNGTNGQQHYRINSNHKRLRSNGSAVSDKLRSSSACSTRNGDIGNGRREVWPGKGPKRQVSLTASTRMNNNSSPPSRSLSPVSLSPPMQLGTFSPPLTSSSPLRPLLTLSASPPPASELEAISPGALSCISNPIPLSVLVCHSPQFSASNHTLNSPKPNHQPRSTSSPVLNHSHENGLPNGVCNSSNHASKCAQKHQTKAVLENGHEKWPSVRLEQAGAATNGTSKKRYS